MMKKKCIFLILLLITTNNLHPIHFYTDDDKNCEIKNINIDKSTSKKDANTAPTFTSTPITNIGESTLYSYIIATNDTNEDTVTISATTLPSWLNFAFSTTVSTLAGSGIKGNNNGNGSNASFDFPHGLDTDANGNVYVADYQNHVIRKIDAAGNVTTLAGSGIAGNTNANGTNASFNNPSGVAVDAAGNVFVCDQSNILIRKIDPLGNVTIFAGSGAFGNQDGAATVASFKALFGIDIDVNGNLYVADALNNSIRKIDSGGNVTTLAGSGTSGNTNGDGIAASFSFPTKVAVDGSGNVFVADLGNKVVRKITSTGNVTTFAGSGTNGNTNGQGTAASFNGVQGIATDNLGNVFVADKNNHSIRKIDASGNVTTFAGSGTLGANNGIANNVTFNEPFALTIDGLGNIFVADSRNYAVRKIESSYKLTGNPANKEGNYSIVLEANDGNGGTTQQSFTLTVFDDLPPSFQNTTPNTNNVAQSEITLSADISEAGTIYYIIVSDNTTAPTAVEVKAGQGNGGSVPIKNGNQMVNSGDFKFDFNVAGLTKNTNYDIYVLAEDAKSPTNTQTTPTKIDVATVSMTLWNGNTNNNWTTASNWSTNVVPITTDDVQIPTGVTNYPTALASVSINSLIMNAGSSLIAQSDFLGTITYTRNLATDNWYLLGIPVANETIEAVIANNNLATGKNSNIGLAPYNNSNKNWNYQTNSSTGMVRVGGGYSVKLASAGTVTFSGNMPTTNLGVAISDKTATGGNAFNLIGNPYPSFLASNVNADNTNNLLTINKNKLSENTLWFWNQSSNSYSQINMASDGFFIAPGQGFFVSASGDNTFNFTEAMQNHNTTDTFQKRKNNKIEITLSVTDHNKVRDTKIYYIKGTTTGFDNGYDSSIFGGIENSFQIYTHCVANNGNRKLGIQSLPNYNFTEMVIPIGLKANNGSMIKISATALNLPSDLNVYLEDKFNNSFTLLNNASDYTIQLAENLKGIGRFYLHTKSTVLNTDDLNKANFRIFTLANQKLRIVGIQNETAQLIIYNILGKQIFKTSFKGNGTNDIEIPSLKSGVYLIRLNTASHQLNKKIIINN